MAKIFTCFAIPLLVVLVKADFSLWKDDVCYGVIGCFHYGKPFDNSWHELPDSPEEIGVSLVLYTPAGPDQGEHLEWKDTSNISLTTFDLDPKADTKVIIHGYLNDGTDYWIVNMTRALRAKGVRNTVVVKWGPGARVAYPHAVANTRVVGAVVGHWLRALRDSNHVPMASVHLVGHSLGAHVAGYAGTRVPGITRITGLDPAGPFFEETDPAVRIDPKDADLVDCIHSDGAPFYDAGFGTQSAWCDVDFYPNGGRDQPGCPPPVKGTLEDVLGSNLDQAGWDVSCSHSRSHDLYVDSILRCAWPATKCDSWDAYNKHECACTGGASACTAVMGYQMSRDAPHGKYYVNTTATEPFC